MRTIRAITATLALMAMTAPVLAQDYHQVAPKTPKAAPAGTVTAPPVNKPTVVPVENKQLLKSVRGLVLVDRVQKIQRNGLEFDGLAVDPSLILRNDPKLCADLRAFLGKPLGTNDLPKISQRILDWYRAHNLPVVDVAFPEQDITQGTLQAVVTVYRVGKINVTGNQWFSSIVLRGEMKLRPGDPVAVDVLSEDLNRLNRNPFRQVNVVLERSDKPGATDISLRTQDRLPLRVYASYDNNGLPVTGRDRYSAGFNWGDLFGLDEQISYQFVTSPDLWRSRDRGAGHSNEPRFMAHSLSYLAPLPYGDFVSVFGTYVQQVPNLGADFDQVGHSLQISARYQHPFAPMWGISHQIQIGFDHKRSDNNLQFGGTAIFAGATNVDQFVIDYGATLPDDYGQTALENQLYWSPGGLGHGNTTAVYAASGVNRAKANYIYDNLQLSRITYLPWQMSAVVRLTAQIATTELLPSEQIGAGGSDSVRGYDPRAANGTEGLLASIELHSPSFAPLQLAGLPVDDPMQGLVFFDSGYVSNRYDQTTQPKHTNLESLGLGVRYNIGRYLETRLDYGWQLERAPGAKKLGNLANFSVTLAY